MRSHQKVLMSLDLRCAYSHPSRNMEAIEYHHGTLTAPEKVVYKCAVCGRQKLVVYRPEAALTSPDTVGLGLATHRVNQTSSTG